jgi:hypothetical protein
VGVVESIVSVAVLLQFKSFEVYLYANFCVHFNCLCVYSFPSVELRITDHMVSMTTTPHTGIIDDL